MAKKATRLHFTEDELANPRVKKAASKADRAADKADRVAAKTPKKRKLKFRDVQQAGQLDPVCGRLFQLDDELGV